MKVFGINCLICGDKVFSRARHDFRYCTCGNVYADGGQDYFRYGAKAVNMYKTVNMVIKQTKDMLYDDWNHRKNKYGIIHFKEVKRGKKIDNKI